MKRVGAVTVHDHMCVTYGTDAHRDEVVAAFLRDGLVRREHVLHFADKEYPATLLARLRGIGVDVDASIERRQLEILTAADSYLATERFDVDATITHWANLADSAVADGFSGLRVSADMAWGMRDVETSTSLHEYEVRIQTELFPKHQHTGLCAFDLRHFGESAVERILGEHPDGEVALDPLWHRAGAALDVDFSPVEGRLSGELDLFSSAGLQKGLAHLAELSAGDVVLNMANVPYIDVMAMRRVVEFAKDLAPRRALVLRNMLSQQRKMFEVLGWESAPGLHLD